MHWYLPQDCLQPSSSDLIYQGHTLWLRASHDPLIYENVEACVKLANWEGKNERQYSALDLRAMNCPRGVLDVRIDPHSIYGRAPFEVQSVDGGWLLEHSNGSPLGYIHAEWSVHCPVRPELDPTLGLDVWLHEIMVRPPLVGHGFGSMMVDKVVEAVGQHVDLLLASHRRLRGMEWSIHSQANCISSHGEKAREKLSERISERINSWDGFEPALR